jgi:hypothetical protein
VLVVHGQETTPPREQRGWPTYESGMSTLIKEAAGDKEYTIMKPELVRGCDRGGLLGLQVWSKVIHLGGGDAPTEQAPPMAPSRFTELLRSKTCEVRT